MAKKKLSAQNRADLKKVWTDIGTEVLTEWIKKVGTKNPGRAAELMLSLAEYIQPKLARTEQVGPGGGPLRVVVKQVTG